MDFIYTIGADTDDPKMVINRHIGNDLQDGKTGIDGAQFQSELIFLDTMGKNSITVYINSPGGSVIDGMSIYQSILDCKTPIKTVNVGIAASIAAIIFQAGDERVMYDYSTLMYHNPYNEDGTEDESLSVIKESLVRMISSRVNIESNIISNMMDVTTWIDADQAKQTGLCDFKKSSSRTREINKLDFKNKFNFINENMDSILEDKKNKNIQMKSELCKILNLSEDSSEEVVYNLVKSLLEKRNEKESVADMCDSSESSIEAENALEVEIEEDGETATEETEMEDMDYKNLYENLLNEYNKIVNLNKEEKIMDLINKAISNGKIKNNEETIGIWKNIALNSFEQAEMLIKDLPINKKSEKINVEVSDKIITDPRMAAYKPNVATIEMQRINNKLKSTK